MTRIMIVVIVALGLGLVMRSRWQAGAARRAHAAATAAALRLEVLSRRILTPARDGDAGAVRGLVMDWGIGNGLATLVATDDGAVSLYLNPGGGILGAGARPAVARAAEAFRSRALPVRGAFAPTTSFPSPGPDSVAFYILTDAATLTSGVIAEEQIRRDTHPLHALGAAAQALLTEVRRARQVRGGPSDPG